MKKILILLLLLVSTVTYGQQWFGSGIIADDSVVTTDGAKFGALGVLEVPYNWGTTGNYRIEVNGDTTLHKWIEIIASRGALSDSTNFWRTKSDFDIFLPQFGSRIVDVNHNPGDGGLIFQVNGNTHLNITANQTAIQSGSNANRINLDQADGIQFENTSADSVGIQFDSDNGGEARIYSNGDAGYFSFINNDGTYDNIRIAEPVVNSDGVTKGFADSNYWPLSGNFSIPNQTITAASGINFRSSDGTKGIDFKPTSVSNTGLINMWTDNFDESISIGNDAVSLRKATTQFNINEDSIIIVSGILRYGNENRPTYTTNWDVINKGYSDSTLAGINIPSIVGQSGNSIRVNGAEDEWEYYTPNSIDQIAGQSINSVVSSPTGTQDGFAITWDNGAGEYTLSAGGAGSGIDNVVEDTSPQLGGNLDPNGFTVGDATAADLTKLNSLTATATELNYTDGVTSNIQTQLDNKLTLGAVNDVGGLSTITEITDNSAVSTVNLTTLYSDDGGQTVNNSYLVELPGSLTIGTANVLTQGFSDGFVFGNGTTIYYETNNSGGIRYSTTGITPVSTTLVWKDYVDTRVAGSSVTPALQSPGAGQDGYSIVWNNASGVFDLESVSGGGSGISSLVEDTSPQLGGNLDLNENTIGTANITNTEIGYLDGTNSNIQTQLDNRVPLSSSTHDITGTSNWTLRKNNNGNVGISKTSGTGNLVLSNSTANEIQLTNTNAFGNVTVNNSGIRTDSTIVNEKRLQDYVGGVKKMVVNIGDWNMDSDGSINISEASLGVDIDDIFDVRVTIQIDGGGNKRSLVSGSSSSLSGAWVLDSNANQLILYRTASGFFDSVQFDQTSFNRGWVVIEYTE